MFNPLLLTSKYWYFYKLRVVSLEFFLQICKFLGLFWVVIEPVSFFFEKFGPAIKPYIGYLFIVALLMALYHCRPRYKFKYFVKDKDVYINVVIGDLMMQKGKDIIIPTNVHFITKLSNQLISPKSIQGQFTKKYYNAEGHLDTDIMQSLHNTPSEAIEPPFFEKSRVYPSGTTAKVAINHVENATFDAYFFAIARLNEHGVAQSSMGEFQQALAYLWNYIQERGSLSDIAIPVIGSGFCRIDASREDLFKEILLSFLAATRNSKFCNSLTIVLYFKDVAEHDIDITAICEFARFHTLNFSRETRNDTITGIAVN